MHYNETASISRATSVSRASKHGSTLSRSQSLIKKNVAPQDLKPSDVLIERFVAWKAIVKQLIAYFEGLADIQNNIAREYTKLRAVIQVPFRAGNQFLGEGGLQVRVILFYVVARRDVCCRMYFMTCAIRPGSLLTNTPILVAPSITRSCSTFRSSEQRSKPTSRYGFSPAWIAAFKFSTIERPKRHWQTRYQRRERARALCEVSRRPRYQYNHLEEHADECHR